MESGFELWEVDPDSRRMSRQGERHEASTNPWVCGSVCTKYQPSATGMAFLSTKPKRPCVPGSKMWALDEKTGLRNGQDRAWTSDLPQMSG